MEINLFMNKIYCSILALIISSSAYANDPEISPKSEPFQSEIEKYLGFCTRASEHIKEIGNEKYKIKLEEINNELNTKLTNDKTNPYLWYLKGCSSRSSLVLYKNKSKEKDEAWKQVINEYDNALKYNDNKYLLKEYQLRKITYSPALIEKSTKQYISLKKKNKRLNKREHLLLLRENIIPSLIKQDKFTEAKNTLDFIDINFPEKAQGETGNIAWRKYFEKEIIMKSQK